MRFAAFLSVLTGGICIWSDLWAQSKAPDAIGLTQTRQASIMVHALDLPTRLQQLCRAGDLDGSAALPMSPLPSACKSML
jgi:hypothetical protein